MERKRVVVEIVRTDPVPNWKVLFIQEIGVVVALCLDVDLAAQGDTEEEALGQLRCIATQDWQLGWSDNHPPVSKRYHEEWEGQRLWTGKYALPLEKRPYLTVRKS